MKKIFFIIISVCFLSYNVFSQTFTSSTKYVEITKPAGLDKIFIFKNIESSTLLEYQSTATSIKWYKLKSGIQTEISNLKYISPENNTGYVLEADGVKTSFWVFDYMKYIPFQNTDVLTASDSETPCDDVKLNFTANVPMFEYENINGGKLRLDRNFTLKYQNIEWESKNWSTPKEISSTIKLPNSIGIFAPAPLINTTFTISGDEFGTELGNVYTISTTSDYVAKAVNCHITTETVSRENDEFKNENSRPDVESLKGSAPLDIHFYSNATPAADTYIWEIYKTTQTNPFISRSVKDNTYTFTEAGKYKVKLSVSNQYCTYTDTIEVEVVESSIAAPKVFTPNNDEVQDEFRVAYQSIIEFDGVILNRWGKKVFSWNNPAKGWDGNIGGRPAAIGPYYYVIKAKGSDGIKYKLKGYVNLLR